MIVLPLIIFLMSVTFLVNTKILKMVSIETSSWIALLELIISLVLSFVLTFPIISILESLNLSPPAVLGRGDIAWYLLTLIISHFIVNVVKIIVYRSKKNKRIT